jgi:2-succinyl-6-hydroxy-2,4-cyclohexadiene-1-carboxylate synthase
MVTRPRALLLHGFTRDHRMWAPLVEGWTHLQLLAPDLPGHGTAPAPAANTAFFEVVDALASRLLAPFGVIGYSMGARLALWLAARHPSKVRWLVLDGASPGLQTEAERADRRARDDEWVRLLRTQGIEAFSKKWAAQPLFGGVAQPQDRLEQSAEGLSAALATLGKGAMPCAGESLSAVRCPLLLLNGSFDTRGLEETARIATALPHARRVVLGGHHAMHAEAPAAWRACVSAFISEQLTSQRPQEAFA